MNIPDDILKQIDVEAEKRFPYLEITKFNEGYIASRERNKKDNHRINFSNAVCFGYHLAGNEIDRLKNLIEEQFKAYHDIDSFDRRWEVFKKQNNL